VSKRAVYCEEAGGRKVSKRAGIGEKTGALETGAETQAVRKGADFADVRALRDSSHASIVGSPSRLDEPEMSLTIEQKANFSGFPKAGELIEITGAHALEASDRALLNILFQHAHESGNLAVLGATRDGVHPPVFSRKQ